MDGDNGARERVLDADLHYLQAVRALSREANGESVQREVDCRLSLAKVSAIRELTDAVERIAVQLERRDVVEERYIPPGDYDTKSELYRRGWIYLGEAVHGQFNEVGGYIGSQPVLGRPRNVPAEGGGEGA